MKHEGRRRGFRIRTPLPGTWQRPGPVCCAPVFSPQPPCRFSPSRRAARLKGREPPQGFTSQRLHDRQRRHQTWRNAAAGRPTGHSRGAHPPSHPVPPPRGSLPPHRHTLGRLCSALLRLQGCLEENSAVLSLRLHSPRMGSCSLPKCPGPRLRPFYPPLPALPANPSLSAARFQPQPRPQAPVRRQNLNADPETLSPTSSQTCF